VKASAQNLTTDVSITIEPSSISDFSTVRAQDEADAIHMFISIPFIAPTPWPKPKNLRSPFANQELDVGD